MYFFSVVRIKFDESMRMAYENQRLTHVVNPCVRIIGHSSVDIPISLSYSGGNATGKYLLSIIISCIISLQFKAMKAPFGSASH